MRTTKDLDGHIKIVIEKMFEFAGINPENTDLDEQDWYDKNTMTKEQEKLFSKWIQDYLYSNTNARRELMNFQRKSKKAISEWYNQFSFYCGLKVV